ncbi:MAG: GNAT family N-acetyltransferase [Gammaproteobacteria bacterium]|nr:GNAT family N-acetyltransferase [Gammaproteobacteria bacterium]MDH5652257.1 GNAT family N-acetyltransferase [Gammaproteobacteria bacterium]
MQFKIIESLHRIKPEDWSRIAGNDYPFTRYEFLVALEDNEGVGEKYGWLPHFMTAWDGEQLVGAVPLYMKDNSYGEFVFDWSWAEAWQRAGLPYYPKYVVGIPYTPAAGQRILADHSRSDHKDIRKKLVQAVQNFVSDSGVSSLHWLFTDTADTQLLKDSGYILRLGCQFHWQNNHYQSFDDYLQTFSAQKRKKVKRERRRVIEQGIELEVRHGNEMTDELWQIYHDFYLDTFDKKWGMATLSLDFFKQIGRTMPASVVVVFAKYQNDYVAGAFNYKGHDTLYGRHWGCNADFHSLHFEACYYQGLDYCIQHGLQHFEPGAQGEHKISRGFLPTRTWSAHWIAHPEFAKAVQAFCAHEQDGMEHYINELTEHSPFKTVSSG